MNKTYKKKTILFTITMNYDITKSVELLNTNRILTKPNDKRLFIIQNQIDTKTKVSVK